jgi:hypothetical protein
MTQTIQIEINIETDGCYCGDECNSLNNIGEDYCMYHDEILITAAYGAYLRCQKCLDAKVVK